MAERTRFFVVILLAFLCGGCARLTTADLKQDKYFIGELMIPMSFEEVLKASLERNEACGEPFSFHNWDQSNREPAKAFAVQLNTWSGSAGVATYFELQGEGEMTVFRVWATSRNAPSYIYRAMLDESLIGILENPTEC